MRVVSEDRVPIAPGQRAKVYLSSSAMNIGASGLGPNSPEYRRLAEVETVTCELAGSTDTWLVLKLDDGTTRLLRRDEVYAIDLLPKTDTTNESGG